MKTYFFSTIISFLLMLCLTSCSLGDEVKLKKYPRKTRVVFAGKRMNVRISNPRGKGNKERLLTKDSTKQIYALNYGISMFEIVQRKDGSYVSPVMIVKEPRKSGLFGGIHMEDRWSMETRAIGPRMEPDVDFADFPIGDDIQKHILILKAFAEETGWRVLELNPDEISDNDEIKLPDLLSLPKLEEDDNADVFLKLHEDASLDEKKIGDRAVQ